MPEFPILPEKWASKTVRMLSEFEDGEEQDKKRREPNTIGNQHDQE